jgi:hypothetical protein
VAPILSTANEKGFDFPITGKITGNFFGAAQKAPWIAVFRDFNARKQGINREY